MNMSLTDWVKLTHPKVFDLYNAWKSIGFELERGQWVETLTYGFSGPPGRQCQFIRRYQNGNIDQYEFGYINEDGTEEIFWGMRPVEIFTRLMPIEHA
jgi:hypothetical protein